MMRERRYQGSMMLSVMLFCLFLLLMTAVTAFSMRAYLREESSVKMQHDTRILSSYLSQKISHSEGGDSVRILSIEGKHALAIEDLREGRKYITYIYQKDGALREIYAEEGQKLNTQAGSEIMPMKDFDLEWKENGLLHGTCCTTEGKTEDIYIRVASERMDRS